MTDIITRAEAKAQGLKTYYTGKPCKHGHDSDRFVSNNGCRACLSAGRKQNHHANKERYNQYSKDYYQQNQESQIERVAQYRAENP